MSESFLEELRWRGLLHQCTDDDGLTSHLKAESRRAYAGFDPTADSLTIGNLVPIMMLVHLARAGHEPVVVMGGGTGLIGDPSGKSAERQLMTAATVESHVASQRRIFEAVFSGAGLTPPEIVNNADWLCELSYLDVLRDVGKHFSVNMMIQKESVKERLHNRDQGISYTEFSYMILQAYDFAHLHDRRGVTIQLGGSDQWGNIVAGIDLIRRQMGPEDVARAQRLNEIDREIPEAVDRGSVADAGQLRDESQRLELELRASRAFGLTCPLVTKSDGGKFGKTESGAIWLTPERTSAYAMYQFWLNASDEDVIPWLKLFTLLSKAEIDALSAAHADQPGARQAQQALAREATRLVHGQEEAEQASKAARALFSGQITQLPRDMLAEVLSEVPSTEHPRAALDGEGVGAIDLLVETSLAKSKREAREFLANGSISVNGAKIGLEDRITAESLLHDEMIALRRGKKAWHLTRWA